MGLWACARDARLCMRARVCVSAASAHGFVFVVFLSIRSSSQQHTPFNVCFSLRRIRSFVYLLQPGIRGLVCVHIHMHAPNRCTRVAVLYSAAVDVFRVRLISFVSRCMRRAGSGADDHF